MKKSVYINSIGSVSVQKTFDDTSFLEDILSYKDTTLKVVDPDYKAYIPPAAARRMAKGIKMSTVSSQTALKEAGLEAVDAIIVGTGLGCLGDSEKFVSDIIDNDEQYLTPTRFIQSSHNTVAGVIALAMDCKGYNFTYVHSSISFESCLIDANLQLATDEASNILVGGVDEMVKHHVDTHRLIGHIKNEPIALEDVLTSKTKGSVIGEGSHFFVLSNIKQDSTYAKLLAIRTYNTLDKSKVPETITRFLEDSNVSLASIDAVIMGNNGDVEFDHYYNDLGATLFENIPQLAYKHLSGEYDTASGFAFWLANKILKTGSVPKATLLNNIKTTAPKTILIYNQYRGVNHSLVLLQKC
ncbi:beta-ketoacyl synthase N-terminal-like domain-containing protein [Maribacter sp. CXY002]|uniref:beta-ketoacyl synthase N-terminal-like domain-containing protein n=1 Tax=Maribacter luteocoastalis TaxID=3407671 RepID=UPI003B66B470